MTWDDYDDVLCMRDVADILKVNVKTVRKRMEQHSPLQPPPAFIRPYRWRKADVKRFVDTASVEHQRRELARAEREASA
jgi:hypothetical protein